MDDPKKIILARRARFVAAAVAGVAVAACDKPRVCLEPPVVTTTAPTRPMICLSAVRIPPDASADDTADDLAASSDAGAGDASRDAAKDAARDAARDAAKPPIGPPAPPRTCLSML